MSYPLVLGCFALAGLGVWISARFFGHPISPFSVFYGIWLSALGLYNMDWIAYTPVRGPAWTLIGLSLFAFGMGWMIPYLAWNPRNTRAADQVQRQISAHRLLIAIGACFVLGAIGAAALLYSVHSVLGLAAYLETPQEIRAAMAAGGQLNEPIKPFNWLNVVNIVLCSFYLFALRGRRRRLVWAVLVFSLVAVLLMEDRLRFFYSIAWAGFVWLHSTKVTARKLLIGFALGCCVLLTQFITVAVWLGKIAENNPALMEVANVKDAMVMLLPPYMYATESFPALQAYMDTAPPSTHGAMTFYPAFKALNLIDPTLEPPKVVGEFVSIPSDANTFTWIQQFYDDFGVFGVLIGPWAIGIISASVYFYMLRNRGFYSIYVNGLFCFCLALSIYANHFTQGPAWYFLAIGPLIAIWIKKPAARAGLA